jgi:hypothetical protein
MNTEDYNDEEQQLFRALDREFDPPAALEQKTVDALKKNNLLKSSFRGTTRRVFRFAIPAVLAAIIFAAGLIAGKLSSAEKSKIAYSESTFIFFLLEDSNFQTPSGERELKERVNEYRNWAMLLRSNGVGISGVKLQDHQEILNGAKSDAVSESPLIRGYFVVQAGTIEKAREIARSCPHARYGGIIQIRQIEPT